MDINHPVKLHKAEASIIGALFIIVLLITSIVVISAITNSDTQYFNVNSKVAQIQATRGTEKAVVSYVSSTGVVTVNDTGANTLVINDAITISSSGTSSQAESLSVSPNSAATFTVATGLKSVGIISSYGNTFWSGSAAAAPTLTRVVFYSSQTWTVPSGVTSVFVQCEGGGGGGGGSGGASFTSGGSSAASGAGAGGGAGTFTQGFVTLGGATSISVFVGGGGGGGSSGGETTNGGSGGNGGTSYLGNLITCSGGQGGQGGVYGYNQYTVGCGDSGGAGDGVPGNSGGSALQYTIFGGGGGGGGGWGCSPGLGSQANELYGNAINTGPAGTSNYIGYGGGGGSASPFSNGGTGGSSPSGCGIGTFGGSPSYGAGGGGGGGSISPTLSCGIKAGAGGGNGGAGLIIVFYMS